MKAFYIADLHFGHKNCLRFDSRPFDTIEEHDEELIRRWNSAVTSEDEVWVVGDLSWISPPKTALLLDRLNGTKNLIVGNHDKKLIKNETCASRFQEITPYKELHVRKGLRVVLCHYPIPCFNHHFQDWVHLYGHVHQSHEWELSEMWRRQMEAEGMRCNMINVGCLLPYMDYTPHTLEEIVTSYDAYRSMTDNLQR